MSTPNPLTRLYDPTGKRSAPPTPPRPAGAGITTSAGIDPYRQCMAEEITELKPTLNALLTQHIGDLQTKFGYDYSPEIWTSIITQALIVYNRTLRSEEITRGGPDKAGRLILDMDEFKNVTASTYAYIDLVGLSTEIVRIGNFRFMDYTQRITRNPEGVPPITFAPMDADGGFGVKILHGTPIAEMKQLINFVVTNPPALISLPPTRKPSK